MTLTPEQVVEMLSDLLAENNRLRGEVERLAEDLRDSQWKVELMQAQRDEAFKRLTPEQQNECIRTACRLIQEQTIALLGARYDEATK